MIDGRAESERPVRAHRNQEGGRFGDTCSVPWPFSRERGINGLKGTVSAFASAWFMAILPAASLATLYDTEKGYLRTQFRNSLHTCRQMADHVFALACIVHVSHFKDQVWYSGLRTRTAGSLPASPSSGLHSWLSLRCLWAHASMTWLLKRLRL